MKNFKIFLMSAAAVCSLGFASCVNDLDVEPIDPNVTMPEDVLNTEEAYTRLLAKCYSGLAASGGFGKDGGCDLSGIDGGFSQYFRGRYHLNGLTTDESVCGWNDQTLQNLHGLSWTTDDVFVAAFYYRIFYQLSALNNFIRYVNRAEIELPEKDLWIAEARTLRALCWLDAIDNYGNVPFADENTPVGMYTPEQISRDSLFNYIEADLKDVLAGDALYDYGQGGYGRANKGLAAMILAKLYLNAEVYTGKAMYAEAAALCKQIMTDHPLHTTAVNPDNSPYAELFMADNHQFYGKELIFVIPQDSQNLTSWGVTNYLIYAGCSASSDSPDEYYMNPLEQGISSGWGGLSLTYEFSDKFDSTIVKHL